MKRFLHAGILAFLVFIPGALSRASQAVPPRVPAVATSDTLTIPAGQKFILQLETAIHTNSTRKGDRIEFRMAGDVYAGNQVVIPARSRVRATVSKAKRAGRLVGRAEVQLRFDEVFLADGSRYPIEATVIRVGVTPVDAKDGQPRIKGDTGPGGNVGSVATAGAQGAVIGVIVGGGKGAMYGGAAGAAISLAGMVFRRGPDLDLPRDTMFEARFDKPLSIPLTVVHRAEQARLAGQAAQNEPPSISQEVPPADEPVVRTRPPLRRPERAQPPVDRTTADSQPPAESTANAGTAEVSPAAAAPPETGAQPVATPPPDVPSTPSATVPVDSAGFKLSVSVKMVLVDAVVRDSAGRMMGDLSQEDFRVYEDGVKQQIQSFSRDALPLAVALVIDRSGSVAPYISELRRIAYDALRQLKQGDKVALFSFAGTPERLEDLTTDRQRIANGIGRIRAGGGTNIIDALFDATRYLAGAAPDYRRAVILVSDNQSTVQSQASEGVTIRKAMETETVIYSLKTSGEATPLTLRLPNLLMGGGSIRKVARETGGEVLDVSKVSMLDTALAGVISRLRLRYALGYYPPSQALGGAFHSIEVRLADRLGRPGNDYFIHARRGYYATSERVASRGNP